jgi:hypothetical protein
MLVSGVPCTWKWSRDTDFLLLSHQLVPAGTADLPRRYQHQGRGVDGEYDALMN